jgi:hypothetical protein
MKLAVIGFGVLFCLAMVPPLLFAGGGATAAGQTAGSGSPTNKRAPGDLTPIWTDCGDARRTPSPCPDSFPSGECTWWAAYNRLVTWNGNGGEWLANAAAQGKSISPVPVVGSIVVYYKNVGYSEFGHVALVTAVGPTSFHVSEMNFVGLGVVSERDSPWPDPVHVEGFVLGG